MAKITTPVEGFNGKVVGVSFVDGHGETDDEGAIAYFERQGYAVEHGDAGPETVEIPDGDPADSWTNAQLKAYAERESIDLGDAKKKDEYLAVIGKALAERKPQE